MRASASASGIRRQSIGVAVLVASIPTTSASRHDLCIILARSGRLSLMALILATSNSVR